MQLKRFQAATLPEALARVERECGKGALLVDTRRTARGYLVVAASTGPAVEPARRSIATAGRRWTPGFRSLAARAVAFGISEAVLSAVEEAMLGTKVDLTRAGDPAVASVASRILGALIHTIRFDQDGDRARALAFLGPTGVGKTTTLAKIAAAAVRAGESVAIVSIDTYRVAAVEQLRAFADMLAVPFEVAFTAQDLRRALAAHRDRDRVLIDTSGRSPFDQDALGQLGGVLATAGPTAVLCLPAALRRDDGLASLRAFERIGVDALVITKWDETRAPGETLSLAIEQGLKISHVTIGQEVPDDILVADGAVLAASAFRLAEAQAAAVLT